ncbi:MAG: 2-hydroxyacid dehydrogenase [Betaproteobacteria bacterium]
MTIKPVIVQVGPLHGPTQEALARLYDIRRLFEASDRERFLASVAADCNVAVTSSTHGMTAALMHALPNLKLVACFGVGVDALDVAHARAHGIAVSNPPDVLTEDVADLALALLLGTVRRIPQGDRFVRDGLWLKGNMALTQSLQGRKVGIVGLGRIGLAIARRCAAFNTELAYFGPREKPSSGYRYFSNLVELARWSDVLIAACPGGADTRGLISRSALEALGPAGLLINIARGSVIDEQAMTELLASGALGAAGLDVFEREPQVPSGLIALDNVVLQPHQGSATHDTRTAMGRKVLENVAAWLDGRPLPNPV